MKAVVLGSGQDGGVPQFGGPEAPERTAASVAIVTDCATVLLDCGPDFRAQHRRLTSLVGEEKARIVAIGLTHGHMGHYTGLVHFGKEAAATVEVPVHATESMHRFLAANEPWASLLRNRHLRAAGTGFTVDGVRFEAFPVPHRAEHTDTVGWSVRSAGLSIAYVPDIDGWDLWAEAPDVLGSHDVALVDGTFFDDHEPIPRAISEIPHPTVLDTIRRFGNLECRIILTHLNHTNALARGVPDAEQQVAQAGLGVAYDGMVVS